MFRRIPKKSEELFLQTTTSPIDDSELIEHQEIMMHDINIEEITKTKVSVLALSVSLLTMASRSNIRIH